MNKAQDTNLIAKAYYNVSNAAKFLHSVADGTQASPDAKRRLRGAANRLEWCIKDIKTSLTPETKAVFEKEIESWETLAFESVAESMLHMSHEQRVIMEEVAKAIRKGELQLQAA